MAKGSKIILGRQSNFNEGVTAKALEVEFDSMKNFINTLVTETIPVLKKKADDTASAFNAIVFGNPIIMQEQIYYGYQYYPVIKEFNEVNISSGTDVLVYEINQGDFLMEIVVDTKLSFATPTGFFMKDRSDYLFKAENIDTTLVMPNIFPLRKEYSSGNAIYLRMDGTITAGRMKIILIILKKTDFSYQQPITAL